MMVLSKLVDHHRLDDKSLGAAYFTRLMIKSARDTFGSRSQEGDIVLKLGKIIILHVREIIILTCQLIPGTQ